MTTHATLKADLGGWLNRDDLGAAEATIVRLAEAEIARRVRTQNQLTRADLTLNAQTVALPSGVLQVKSLTLQDSSYSALERVSVEVLRESTLASDAGTPTLFAIQGDSVIVAPYPSASTPVVADLVYWARYDALSADADTNWLLTNHYDVYLWAVCKQGAVYVDDAELEARFERKFAEAIQQLKLHEQSKARGGGAISSYVHGAV